MKASATGSVTPVGFVNTTQSNEAKIKWFGTVRAKAGYAANNWLLYGTGRLAYGKVEQNTALNCPACNPPQFFAGSSSKTKIGWTIGAGLDYGLTPNWILGVEYLYFDLGSDSTTAMLTRGIFVFGDRCPGCFCLYRHCLLSGARGKKYSDQRQNTKQLDFRCTQHGTHLPRSAVIKRWFRRGLGGWWLIIRRRRQTVRWRRWCGTSSCWPRFPLRLPWWRCLRGTSFGLHACGWPSLIT